MLARALNLLYIDTGSMYRAVALAVIEAHVDPTNTEVVTRLADRIEIDLEGDPESLRVLLNGRDITEQIRTERVTAMSSIVSTIPGVRRAMVGRQRAMGKRGAVLNGRDIGTVVFPDADIKFFLTAVPEERAERRFKEDQMSSSPATTLAETLAEMIERDQRDSTRADSPLKIAGDAIVIDSSGKTIEEVFVLMMETIKNPKAK
jgi:cytidylate kinase